MDVAEDWTQDPLQNIGQFLHLTARPRRRLWLNVAHLKVYIFKYEQNNNRLLEIYKNKQADTH